MITVELPLCACGCGRRAGVGSRFIRGHHKRLAMPAKTREKISRSLKGRPIGEKHHLWAGDAVGYEPLHQWVARYKVKTGKCSTCNYTGDKTQWANVSGMYFRDLDDFAEMCQPCHKEFDDPEWADKL